MNKLSLQKRAQIISLLVEGNSMRATSRLADCSINTVTKLLVDIGYACAFYQNEAIRNIESKRVQCDEIWSFCYSKEKNVAPENKGILGHGDAHTWTAIDADTKLAISWLVDRRDHEYAEAFIYDLATRLAGRIQLTTDGHGPYLGAVEKVFGGAIDYAMLVKIYGEENQGQKRYSPAQFVNAEKRRITGNPDMKEVSTSYVERQNLEHAIALHFMHYNFCRIHKTLKTIPALEAGIADRLWELEDIAKLLD